jgi:hypothetical protein
VASNTAIQLSVTSAWTTIPDATSTYAVSSAGQSKVIASNTATELTVTSAWTTNPDNTSVYTIRYAKMCGTPFSSEVFHTLTRQWHPAVQWDPPWEPFGWHPDFPGGLYPTHANFSSQSQQGRWNYVGPYPTPSSTPIFFFNLVISGTTCTLTFGDFDGTSATWTRTGRVPWGTYNRSSATGPHAAECPETIEVTRVEGAYPWKSVPWA